MHFCQNHRGYKSPQKEAPLPSFLKNRCISVHDKSTLKSMAKAYHSTGLLSSCVFTVTALAPLAVWWKVLFDSPFLKSSMVAEVFMHSPPWLDWEGVVAEGWPALSQVFSVVFATAAAEEPWRLVLRALPSTSRSQEEAQDAAVNKAPAWASRATADFSRPPEVLPLHPESNDELLWSWWSQLLPSNVLPLCCRQGFSTVKK